jgi:hypothetical protein
MTMTNIQRFIFVALGGSVLLLVAIYTTVSNAAIRVVLPDGGIVMVPVVEYKTGAVPTVYVGTLFSSSFEN